MVPSVPHVLVVARLSPLADVGPGSPRLPEVGDVHSGLDALGVGQKGCGLRLSPGSLWPRLSEQLRRHALPLAVSILSISVGTLGRRSCHHGRGVGEETDLRCECGPTVLAMTVLSGAQ